MSPPETPFKPGDSIAKEYTVIDILGRGAVGTVYLAENSSKQSIVAIKALNPGLVNSEKARELFLREARIWLSIESHPNILHPFGIVRDGADLFIIMAYIAPKRSGESSLAGYLSKSRKLPVCRILTWTHQFCEGMKHAYQQGIKAHRDIKPQNILITRNGFLKISDFGLASVHPDPMPEEDSENPIPSCVRNHNILTSAVGTYLYMSPEHYRDPDLCDEQSDIYSFGIVLYQMVTGGSLPFLATPPSDRSREEFNRFVSDMRRLHCDVPPPMTGTSLDKIIQTCLAKDPYERYGSFEDLQLDLSDQFIIHKCPRPESREPWIVLRPEKDFVRGLIYVQHSRFEDALSAFTKAEEEGYDTIEFVAAKADCLASLGHVDEALWYYKTKLDEKKQDSRLFYYRGLLLAKLGRHDEALKDLVFGMASLYNDPEFQEMYWEPFVCMAEDPAARPVYAHLLDTPFEQVVRVFFPSVLRDRKLSGEQRPGKRRTRKSLDTDTHDLPAESAALDQYAMKHREVPDGTAEPAVTPRAQPLVQEAPDTKQSPPSVIDRLYKKIRMHLRPYRHFTPREESKAISPSRLFRRNRGHK